MASSAYADEIRMLRWLSGSNVLNHWHADEVVGACQAIDELTSSEPLQQLIAWVDEELCCKRERTRRLTSHHGTIHGVD